MNLRNYFKKFLYLIVFPIIAVSCSSPEKDKLDLFNNALELIKNGNQEAAILELRSAIQLDAKYGEARYQLGLLYTQKGDPKSAFNELVRAADLLPDNIDANLRVAQFYLLSGKKDDARKKLSHVLEKSSNHREALVLLANLELSEKAPQKALSALEKISEDISSSDELLNLKGRVHVVSKDWEAAEAAFKQAIAVNPNEFLNYKSLLLFYEARKDKENTRNTIEEIISKFPDNTDARQLQIGYFRTIGNVEKAAEESQKLVELAPQIARYRLQLADLYHQLNKTDFEEAVLVKGRTDLPKEVNITAALATFYFEIKNYSNAQKILDELKKEDAGHGGGKLLEARFLQKDGKFRESLSLLNTLNKSFPEWADPFYYLALAHHSLGETDLAQNAVATAIKKNPSQSQYRTFLAQLFLTKGDFENARSEASTALKINSKDLYAALILTRAMIGAKQFEQAESILLDINKQIPGNTEILNNLALAALGNKNEKKAEYYLQKVVNIDPTNALAISLLINIKHRDDPTGAELFIEQQIIKDPHDPKLYIMLGKVLEKQKQMEKALGAYQKAEGLSAESLEATQAAARLLLAAGKKSEAMTKFTTMVERNPQSIPGLMGLAAIFEAEGKITEAKSKYQDVLSIKENYAPAANNLAWLLVSEPNGDIGKALVLAMLAKQAMPNDPNVADTLGYVHLKRESYSLAITQFEFALQNLPDNPAITYHLALAQKGNNQKRESLLTLEKLLVREVQFAERTQAEELLQELRQ